jgi:hypothetical protein
LFGEAPSADGGLGAILCVCPRRQLESSADAEQRMTALIREAALAHIVRNKTEAARRGDLFEKRRDLMAAWAKFVGGASASPTQLKPARTNG